MIKRILAIIFTIGIFLSSMAQQPGRQEMGRNSQQPDGRPQQTESKVVTIKKSIKKWQLIDDNTFADSLALDTMVTTFQVTNPVKKSIPMILHTGVVGAPYKAITLSDMTDNQDFIFANSLNLYFPDYQKQIFYNTTVPYSNITYTTGSPKRSEDNVKVMFSQNINKKVNFGFSYNLMSSLGTYMNQQTDNEMSRIWTSYDGEKYAIASSIAFNNITHHENGGISDSSYILDPKSHNEPRANTIPVNFQDATNRIKNVNFFMTQKLGFGKVGAKDTTDTETPSPVGVLYHTLNISSFKRAYKINNLEDDYSDVVNNPPFYKNLYTDTLKTRDTSNYSSIKNIVQLKLSEEANPFLRFGLRVYLLNDVMFYKFQTQPIAGSGSYSGGDFYPEYNNKHERFVNTALGAQIFKNRGENFWWNASFQSYFQGQKAGDSRLAGNMNSRFRIGNDTAGVFASANIDLRSAGFYFEHYYSNHFVWDNSFNQEKQVKIRGGIRIPTKRFELTGEVRLINDYLYWNQEAMPDQSTGVTKAIEVNLNQSFKLGILNSINRVWWQTTSNSDVLPLPTFSIYSSNFIDAVAFKVLRFQLGFDVTYHTDYYAYAYMPATGQFYVQNDQKIGGYPFADAFINLHLKRVRLGFKFDHVNQGMSGYDYFIMPDYPAMPRSFKISVSWNFFD